MFQLLLHPIVDLRSLLPDVQVARLNRPLWPTPTVKRDFLRSSGAVLPRLQGGVDDWAGEDNYADASLALRLPDGLGTRTFGDRDGQFKVGRVFRRFYCSGIVGRFELGFRIARLQNQTLDCLQTARFLEGTTSISSKLRGASSTLRLVEIGPAFARQHLASTTDRTLKERPQPWWVVAGEPALIVEYQKRDSLSLLPHARLASSAKVGAEVLHHAWVEIASQRLSVWFLQRDNPNSDPTELRKLRIHLVRLHSEASGLRAVLQNAHLLGKSVEQADALQDYLNRTLPLLTRPLSHGVEQSQLLEVARAAWNGASPGTATSLASLGNQVASKVARYVQRSLASAPIITQIIEKQMNTHIQLGNVTVSGDFNLVTAENIQNSFNKAANSEVSTGLKEALKDLTTKTAELAKKLPEEMAEEVSKNLATLTAEAVSKAPRKKWYELSADGLLEAAKTVASMAAPIATAVSTVLALL